METGSISSASGFFELAQINLDERKRNYFSIQRQTTSSGDSVDISEDAKKLYSEMIHKYDQPTRTLEGEQSDSGAGGGQGASGSGAGQGVGGSEESSSEDEIEKIRKQIASLESQLMVLAAQAESSEPGSAAMSKMNALQGQIAALKAQLDAMQAA